MKALTQRIVGIALALAASAGLLTYVAGGHAQAPTKTAAAIVVPPGMQQAIFAGGCFWCMEGPFDRLDGVLSTTSGYTGGTVKNPGYQAVSAGGTGHTEAVAIVFDPKKVSYAQLLDVFWHNIDPTVKDRQFCDVGSQYRTGIFYKDADQQRAAEASKAALSKDKPFAAPIVTEITAATEFYPAEDYHQDYYLKNPVRYKYYRTSCGRDSRLDELWGKTAGVGAQPPKASASASH